MRSITLAALLVAMSFTAQAEVYQCVQNGKKVFSDLPCGNDAKKLTVKPSSGAAPSKTENASAESKAYVEKANLNAKKRELDEEIERTERRIASLHSERDKKLNYLQNEKSRANNNLAGAVWTQSLSDEMMATTNAYNAKISGEEKKLGELKEKRASLN